MTRSSLAALVALALTVSCGRAPDDGHGAAALAAPETVAYRVPIDGAPALGDARALVTLVGFSDYECPFCGRTDALVTQLRKAYGPALRVVMRQHPLPIHAHARAAALAAIAADAQGKFWPMHERLFASSRSLDDASLVRIAGEAGLDVARWQADRASAGAALARDESIARDLAVMGTPSFFVNGRRITGAQPIDTFRDAIDEELAKAKLLVARGVRPEDVYDAVQKDALAKAPALAAPPARPGSVAAAAPAAEAAPAKPGCGEPGGDCGCDGHAEEAPDLTRHDVPLGAAPIRGGDRAAVTVVVFSDFECPFCLRSEATLRALTDQYGGKVRFAFKNTPLPMHPSARAAAKAAIAAGEQGKFWEYHDVLFTHQDALDEASLARYAKELGLDVGRFEAAMADPRTEARVQADEADAARLGVTGTPTFFVNGRRLNGAQPLPVFQSRVELALSEPQR